MGKRTSKYDVKGFFTSLGVEESEIFAVVVVFLFSCVLGIPRVLTVAAATSLFLESYSSADLPKVWIISSVVVPLVGLSYMRLEKALSRNHLLAGSLAVLMGLQLLFWYLLRLPGNLSAAAGYLAWMEAEWALSGLVFWSLAGGSFTMRQSRRLFGVVSSGEILASIMGGAAVPVAAATMGTRNLPLVSAGAIALALALFAWASKHLVPIDEKPAEQPKTAVPANQDQSETRTHIRNIILVGSSFYVSFYFLENIFLSLAEKRMDTDTMAGFLGVLSAAVGITVLLSKVLVYRKFSAAFGLQAVLLFTPVTTLVASAAAVAFIVSGYGISLVFPLLCLVKFIERYGADAMHRQGYQVLFQVLPPAVRFRAMALADSVTGPLTVGLAAVALLFLNSLAPDPVQLLLILLCGVLALWSLSAYSSHVSYQTLLARTVNRGKLNAASFSEGLIDEGTIIGLSAVDPARRLPMIRSLGRMQMLAKGLDPAFVWRRFLKSELEYASRVLVAQRDVNGEGLDIVRHALKEELVTCRERVSFGLGLIYGRSIMTRFWCLYARGASEREVAMAYLESTLRSADKVAVMPLFEEPLHPDDLKALEKQFGHTSRSPEERITEILLEHQKWQNPWLRATAAYVAGKRDVAGLRARVLEIAASPEEPMRSMAQESLHGTKRIVPGKTGQDMNISLLGTITALEKTNVFRDVSRESLAQLSLAFKPVLCNAGEPLYRAGQQSTVMHFVADGKLLVVTGRTEGIEIGPGEIVGELALFLDEPRSRDVFAAEDSVLLELQKTEFHKAITRSPAVGWGVVRMLCERIRAWNDQGTKTINRGTVFVKPSELRASFDLPAQEKAEYLRSQRLFAMLSEPLILEFARQATVLEIARGGRLCSEGDDGTDLYIVLKGEMGVFKGDLRIATIAEREIVGELAALTSEARSATVVAMKPSVLLAISQEVLHGLIEDYPEILIKVIKMLSARLSTMPGRVADRPPGIMRSNGPPISPTNRVKVQTHG